MLGASVTIPLIRDRAAAECVYIQASLMVASRSRRYNEQKNDYAEEIGLGGEVGFN